MPVTQQSSLARPLSGIMYGLCILCTLAIISVLLMVTIYLLYLGWHSLSWSLFTQDPIPQGAEGFPGGMRNGLVGSLILVGIAALVGLPLGIGAGIYISEYSAHSRLGPITRFVCDVLAGVPSIVVGILGYQLLVVPAGHYNGWAGSMALAFIMIPIVARTTEEMLRLVPHSYREAAIALGATKARTILEIVLPAAGGSLFTGIMLALARIAGETAPLLFTALGSRFLTTDPNSPFPSLTVQIFDNAMAPSPLQQRTAWAGMLILISMILVLNLTVRYFTRVRER